MTQTMQVPPRTDAEIQLSVLRELRWDARVDPAHIGVTVEDGVVTLTGTVGSYAEKVAAQEAAHTILGVLDVANDIEVKVPGDRPPSDADIAHAVRHALEWDALVPHEDIRSTVTDGFVTLEGTVPSLVHRKHAERVVRNLVGVRGLLSNIEVEPPPADPEQVRAAIEEALERRAEREANRIQVEVKDGTVRLIGPVYSWREARAILGAAGHAPGIRRVEDYLYVAA